MIIYVITNKLTGKQYVGQTIQTLEKRWSRHGWHCTTAGRRMPISDAIGRYGKENFSIETLKNCSSLDDMNFWEKYYVNTLNTWVPNGYNLKAGNGSGACSDEIKKKISRSNKGRKVSQETRDKLSKSHKGIRMSDETRRKLSNINKGKPLSELARENSIKASSKTYELILADGNHQIITNMAEFARNNGYSKSKLCELVRRKRHQYRGITRHE